MSHDAPPELRALLARGGPPAEAWRAFLDAYSALILHAARSLGGDHDAVMDRYAHVLEQLRRDDCRRLQGWDGRSRFTTWLVAVVRNLSVDAHRRAYGRARQDGPEAAADRVARRRLVELVGEAIDLETLADDGRDDPEAPVREAELRVRLAEALAALEPADRLLLRLRFVEGLTFDQLARLLRLPSLGRARHQHDRVLARLRAALAARGVTDATP